MTSMETKNEKITDKMVCKCCGRELPISEFSMAGYGHHKTCKECEIKKRKQSKVKKSEVEDLQRQLEEARTARLNNFTPRELMLELKRRGYEGELTYTETRTINIAKLT